MYCQFFGLARMPFDNTPDPRFFFATPEHDEALAALRYGVAQRRGFTLITGQPGGGKTLLGRMLIHSLGPRALSTVVSHTPEDAHDLIASLCRGLGIRVRLAHSTGQLVERLHGALVARYHEDRLVVAVIDEAQNLTPDVLEHVRMLGNLEQDTAKLLQIVLLGQPELVPLLHDPQLDQLRQRIFCSRRINPLTRGQVHPYVHHRLRVAGAADGTVFSDGAIDLVYDRSGGIPRLVNQIADNSLLVAFGASQKPVGPELVAEAIEQTMEVQLGLTAEVAGLDRPSGTMTTDAEIAIEQTAPEPHNTRDRTTSSAKGPSEQPQPAQDEALISALQANPTAADIGVLREVSDELADLAEQAVARTTSRDDVPAGPDAPRRCDPAQPGRRGPSSPPSPQDG